MSHAAYFHLMRGLNLDDMKGPRMEFSSWGPKCLLAVLPISFPDLILFSGILMMTSGLESEEAS